MRSNSRSLTAVVDTTIQEDWDMRGELTSEGSQCSWAATTRIDADQPAPVAHLQPLGTGVGQSPCSAASFGDVHIPSAAVAHDPQRHLILVDECHIHRAQR
jgi:hypothetical protein